MPIRHVLTSTLLGRIAQDIVRARLEKKDEDHQDMIVSPNISIARLAVKVLKLTTICHYYRHPLCAMV